MTKEQVNNILEGKKIRLDKIENVKGNGGYNRDFVNARKRNDIGKVFTYNIDIHMYWYGEGCVRLTTSLPDKITRVNSIIDGNDENSFILEMDNILFYITKED